MPRCKHCKDRFEPKSFNMKYCMLKDECIKACMLSLKEQRQKQWNKEKKARKEKLKTKGDYLKEVQTVFNTYIRKRDNGLNCISCQKPPLKKNAGHYRSVGSCPELRFEEMNVHLQCEHCNTYLHANLIEYRKHLINKIGLKNVEWIEGNHEPKRYTKEQLIELKEIYKQKIKEL